MRSVVALTAFSFLCAGYLACSGSATTQPFGADDGGTGNGSSSGSGSGSGSGSSGTGSSGTGSSGTGSSGTGSSGTGSSGTGSSSSSGSTSCTTNNGPIAGSVTATGGSISRLVFAVVGDTRPANEDDVSGYPTSIITSIYKDIEAMQPRPMFALGTGDYQFSSTGSNGTGDQQISLYLQAAQGFSGMTFPAMGNHECGVGSGCSTSDNCNCGPGNSGGVTANYNAFMNQMMAPLGQTKPYYSFNVSAQDNSWTAKFVITAANAWDTAQQTWLQGVMAQKTTYTFVVRHEASDATPPLPPGVAGVDSVIAGYPYTMMINGHAHTYYWYYGTPNQMTVGNGGAPLTSKTYGYAVLAQRCDGAMVGDMYDYQTNQADPKFHFVITPDGKETK